MMEVGGEGVWPVYEDYQKELQNINQRLVKLLNDYAADYRTNSVLTRSQRNTSTSPSNRLR